MDLTNHVILLAGALLLLSVISNLLSARYGVPLLLVFLVLGMAAGVDGLGIRYHDVQSAHLLGSLALAIILFDGGLRTDIHTFRVGLFPAFVLATAGVAITAGITALVAAWALDLHWPEALLVGAVVGSTDAAAVFGLLHARGLELKQRVGATLEIESGINDPMAVFLTIVLVHALGTGRGALDWEVAREFFVQMGAGTLIGLAGGYLLVRSVNKLQLTSGLYPLLVLAGVLTVFGGTASAGGSGFLAVYLAGLVLGNRPLQSAPNIRRFHDALARLAQIGMFLVLGLLVTPSKLLQQSAPTMVVAAALILVARPAAVLLCLAPFRFPWREQLYVAWVGLRGAVPIILGLYPLLAGLEHGAVYFNVAFFVVLVSLVLQGWTVAPAARWLGLDLPPSATAIQRVELDLPGQSGLELVAYRIEPASPLVGRSVQSVPMPRGCRLAGVIDGGVPLDNGGERPLQPGYYVYLLASPRDLRVLDQMFTERPALHEAAERRFFGEFVLHGDARLGDVAAVYGFDLPAGAADQTISQHLAAHFHRRQVVGDRLRLGEVEVVVREVRDDEVVKVGLKLPQQRASSEV